MLGAGGGIVRLVFVGGDRGKRVCARVVVVGGETGNVGEGAALGGDGRGRGGEGGGEEDEAESECGGCRHLGP